MERAYKKVDNCPYELAEVLSIFEHYFLRYEQVFRQVHPNIRLEQIKNIIESMPYIENHGESSAGDDITPGDYKKLIDKHFRTQYRNCNYNVNHFFSGDVRLLRYYEELY